MRMKAIIERMDEMLRRNGYRFLAVQPKEAMVYYRQISNKVQVIVGIRCHDGFLVNEAMLIKIGNSLKRLLSGEDAQAFGIVSYSVPIEIEQMYILFTNKPLREKSVCAAMSRIWLVDVASKQLIIYENQPQDFYGLYAILEDVLNSPTENSQQIPIKQSKSRIERAGRKIGYCNIALLAANIIVFIILSIMGDTTDGSFMVNHGAMYPYLILGEGKWYLLFTSMFLHFGFMHLINNMVILACVGNYLERSLGSIKYLFLYIVSGIVGNLLSLYMEVTNDDPAVSAGASGAIFGVIGGLLWLIIINKGRLENLSLRGILIMIALSLYFGATTAGVDNMAHIGGLIGGFVFALFTYKKTSRRNLGGNR